MLGLNQQYFFEIIYSVNGAFYSGLVGLLARNGVKFDQDYNADQIPDIPSRAQWPLIER